MARKGAARADIVEVIGILMASSGDSFIQDSINRFSITALRLILDGESPETLCEEFETVILGNPRLPDRDRRPPVFMVSPDGKETRIGWTDTTVSNRHDLFIKGDVSDGLSVRSSGSIRVVGQVYAASIDAEGGIEVEGCVFGKGKAIIRCGRDFRAAAFERARLESGGDVHLGAAVEPTLLTCAGDLVCKGGSDVLLGGLIRAGGSVHAGTIGGPLCTRTTVAAGDPSLAKTSGSQPHESQTGNPGIIVTGTIHERTELSVGQSRISLRQAFTGVKIREEGVLLRLEAADAI